MLNPFSTGKPCPLLHDGKLRERCGEEGGKDTLSWPDPSGDLSHDALGRGCCSIAP